MKNTLIDLFNNSCVSFSERVFLWEKDTEYRPTTYAQTQKRVQRLGGGLCALGIQPKTTISILSEGRNDWIISELALLHIGAISVPLSIKLEESNDLYFRLHHAEVQTIFVSGSQLHKIRAIKAQLPELKNILLFDSVETLEPGEMYLWEVEAKGELWMQEHFHEFMALSEAVDPSDYATITYTSGTTADPKGVILTHRNYTANVEQALSCMTIPPDFRTLIILPLDHCFAHVVGFYIMIACGASVATVQIGKTPMETLKNIPVNIREIKPHFLLSVPALAKSFRKNIENNVKSKGAVSYQLFLLGLRIAYAYNLDGYSKGSGWRAVLKPLNRFFDALLFSKIREGFGGELQFFVGGGALLDAELQRFFYAIGIPMYQGYGLSEATPVISTNCPRIHKFGSSGIPVSPLKIQIIDADGKALPQGQSGEIVIQGENVMAGYWKNPTATAETVKDGWLYTGDLGYISREGLLYVLGRFKSLLISSDGEKYSPEGMEEAIVSQSPYIEQILLHNNQNAYTIALLVPNKEAIKHHFLHHHKSTDAASGQSVDPKKAIALLQHELNKYRKQGEFEGQFPERWLPTTFVVLSEPFSEKNGMVNSTMKIVRNKVEQVYRERMDAAYRADGKDIYNSLNISEIRII